MKQAYLFVHFKEKHTPDGEQVYFGLSRDGFHWEQVNGGNPILESTLGDRGVRDFTIVRTQDNRFVILATDLGLARHFSEKYLNSWDEISRHGSKDFVLWESADLIHWSGQRMVRLGNQDFGCLWAPDIIFDKDTGNYVVHWSSSHKSNGYGAKRIYYSCTKDFRVFSEPQVLYEKEDSGIIDSAMYMQDGKYYLFVKSEENPSAVILLTADVITGSFRQQEAFNEEMQKLEQGQYEAPTAMRCEDGRWCLFLDFYGTEKEGQGYVPFLAERIESGIFKRADRSFSFPYGFKHGTILPISPEEYNRIKDAFPGKE